MQTIVPPVSLADDLDDRGGVDDTDALLTLYNRTVDAVQGYDRMVEKAEPAFRDTAEAFRTLHADHAGSLARFLAEAGVDFDSDGTLMGTVNKAVVAVRAFFDQIDEDVMDQIRNGEDWILDAFDDAIAEQTGTACGTELQEMRAELTDLLARKQHIG